MCGIKVVREGGKEKSSYLALVCKDYELRFLRYTYGGSTCESIHRAVRAILAKAKPKKSLLRYQMVK